MKVNLLIIEDDELDIVVEKALESRRLRSEVLRLRHQTRKFARPQEILGTSPAIQRVKELIVRVAQTPHTPVLIQGESGTGKELVADAIHYAGDRAERPLVKVNCCAISDSLLESELILLKASSQDHDMGSFRVSSGHPQDRVGRVMVLCGSSSGPWRRRHWVRA